MSVDAQQLFKAFLRAGIGNFAGVPCSILDPLTSAAAGDGRYLIASVEGEALCLAAGTWLAGGQAAVLLQNSGLGNTLNPLASLVIPYQIPVLLIISWRGEPGQTDAVHHYPMGKATPGLLDIFEVKRWILSNHSDPELIAAEVAETLAVRRPAAIIVPRGILAKGSKTDWQCSSPLQTSAEVDLSFNGGTLPTRSEVIQAFVEHCGEVATVSTTGYTSRELASYGPRDHYFYMQGSMGFALAIALGAALKSTKVPVFVLDGDGALIMRLGSLATVGAYRPSNLVHLVLDNGTYASTGGQPTASPNVDFVAVARACGYRRAARCVGRESLVDAMQWVRHSAGSGPALIHIQISVNEGEAQERPEQSPYDIATCFRRWYAKLIPLAQLPGHSGS